MVEGRSQDLRKRWWLVYPGHCSVFWFVKWELVRSELHHCISRIGVDAEGVIIFLGRAALGKRTVSLRHRYPASPVDLPLSR